MEGDYFAFCGLWRCGILWLWLGSLVFDADLGLLCGLRGLRLEYAVLVRYSCWLVYRWMGVVVLCCLLGLNS